MNWQILDLGDLGVRIVYPAMSRYADVAELADALDLGSSGATRAGSIPVIRID